VKVRADAVPLDGPLAGGVEGGSVIVEPIEAGRAHFPPALFELEPPGLRGKMRALGIGVPRSAYSDLPVPAFLIRHPGVGPVLVDTGLHPSVASDPRQNLGRLAGRYFSLEQGGDVPAALRAKGLRPADIAVVVLTHLHHDHASAISEFPEAVFVVSAPEWEVATERPKARKGYRPAQYDFGFDYVTVDFDGDEVSSYGSFGRTIDLFGDGTVRLAFTPGHSEGHMSVIARLPRRDFVIAGDVAYTWRQLQGGPEPYMAADRHNWRRSLHELQAFRQAYPYTLIVPGHDPEFWPKLEDRYEE